MNEIKTIRSPEFARYGAVLEGDFEDVVEYLTHSTDIPAQGNVYVANDPRLLSLASSDVIREREFGMLDMQAGYCNGKNSVLNCMEYHLTPEVDVAASRLVLLLGRCEDICEGAFDSSLCEAFVLERGDAVCLKSGTLHFSPCRALEEGFRCAIYLPTGTNLPLNGACGDPMLFKVNKWLLAHPDAPQAKQGAYVGIKGENLKIEL